MIEKKLKSNLFIFLLIFAFFMQITFVPQLFANYAPNFVLILLLSGSIIDRSSNIFYISFLTGFILEIFSGISFGLILVSLITAVFFVSILSSIFIKKLYSYSLLLVCLAGVLIYNVVYILLLNINSIQSILNNFNEIFYITIIQIMFALILIYPLTYFILQKNEK